MSAATTPRLIKCRCVHCSEKIEFDPEEIKVGQEVPCPHCGLDTALYISVARVAAKSATPPAKARRRKWILIAALVALVLTAAVFFIAKGFLTEALVNAGLSAGAQLFALAVMLALVVIAVIVVIYWIAFPLIVHFDLVRLEELLKKIEVNTRPGGGMDR